MAYWSDLPPELLDLVVSRLDVWTDTRCLRSVCSLWRSTIHQPVLVQFPVIKFFNSKTLYYCDLKLEKHTLYHMSAPSSPDSPGWLIKTQENNLGTVRLFNPFSRSSIKNFPPNFPKELNLVNIKIQELGYEYVLRNVSGNTELYNMEHEKVAVIIKPSKPDPNDFIVLSTHNTGKLLMYRSDQQVWSFLEDFRLGYDDRSIFVNDWSRHYVDVVEFNATFYAVTNSGRTVSIKVDEYSTVHVTILKNVIIGGDKKYLVKLADDLLMVDLYTDTTPKGSVKVYAVEIYKLDEEDQKWCLYESLGGNALFLSDHSLFSSNGLKGCKANCIYFRFNNFDKNKCCSFDTMEKGECEENDGFEWKNDEIGVFDFGKGIVGCLEDYLEFSQLFSWPPPSWVTMERV